MSLTVDAFPEEIFTTVLTSLKLISGSSALIPCLLCCKRWHQSAIRIFYQAIILRSSKLEHFCLHFPESQGGLVRTLTVALDYPIENPDCVWWKDAFLGTRKTRRMKHCLRALSGLIHCMSNLTTSSFEIRHDASGGTTNLEFPRDTLTKMLLALPQTCINLEITICGPEEQNNRRPDTFCKTLGQILPRLHHVRLQVGRLCPELLGRGVVKKDDADGSVCIEEFKPFYAANLKSMVTHCHYSLNSYYIDIPSDQTELCELYCAKGSREGKSDAKFEAGLLLRSLLHDLVQQSSFLVINRLLVHSGQPDNGTVKTWDVIGIGRGQSLIPLEPRCS